MMWKIPCITHPPPISIPIWYQWAGLTASDLTKCWERAIGGTVISKAHVMSIIWSMKAFATPGLAKYKYMAPMEVRVKVQLQTDDNRLEMHRSGLFNWHRLYFRCLCMPSSKNGCKGEVLWFDHAVWYILNHLQRFFPNCDSIRSMFVEFPIFLSTSSDAVRDQITFMYTRELMIEAALEQHDKPQAKLLTSYGVTEGTLQIERLINQLPSQ